MEKVVVVGANGRMGQEIISALENSKLEFGAGVDTVGDWKSYEELDPNKVAVVIDFSSPASFVKACEWCLNNQKPMVSGTTGITEKEKQAFHHLAQSQAAIWSANMSLGVNFLAELIKKLKFLEEDFDFQIEEFHHRHKIDKPSGTALLLQKSLQSELKKTLPEPLSIRGGGIFGIHRVYAMSEEETISIEHVALNRQVFAKGAVKAAEWIVNKKAGNYSMKDVLGL
ncbi:MAG: 4-hydroxy-tetrahydrodipicolinate reductase [Bdellovibrionaceae bacterium]|nr:4-hydroxy-tetrahydrodipicolinate reductase [Pseudobdellovibrionaceae bacterium]